MSIQVLNHQRCSVLPASLIYDQPLVYLGIMKHADIGVVIKHHCTNAFTLNYLCRCTYSGVASTCLLYLCSSFLPNFFQSTSQPAIYNVTERINHLVTYLPIKDNTLFIFI